MEELGMEVGVWVLPSGVQPAWKGGFIARYYLLCLYWFFLVIFGAIWRRLKKVIHLLKKWVMHCFLVFFLLHSIKFCEFWRLDAVEEILILLEVVEGYSPLDELLYGVDALLKVCQATLDVSILSLRYSPEIHQGRVINNKYNLH